jgi:hypothetical protein
MPKFLNPVEVASHFGAIVTDADAATITFDLSVADKRSVTLGGNRTLAVANAQVGQQFTLILIQNATGGWTPTWWAGITWMTAGGTVPPLSAAAGKINVFTFLCVGSGAYYGFLAGQNG